MKLNDLYYFVQVVDQGGFSAAARALGLPKSSLSKRIAVLEQDLGARLIQRTTRRLALTEAGQAFHRHAAAALLEAQAAQEAVTSRLAEPRGLVRISASPATVQMGLADILPGLARRYPKIRIALTATHRYVDLIQEGIDIAIRAHRHPLPDSELVQRRLGYAPNYLVAAPSYLAERGHPRQPADLAAHDGIFTDPLAAEAGWRLHQDGAAPVAAHPTARIYADDPHTMAQAALNGLAIANLPHGLCGPAIAAGRLVRLLPAWDAGGATTTLLVPHRRGQLPSVRAVLDYLAETLPGRTCPPPCPT